MSEDGSPEGEPLGGQAVPERSRHAITGSSLSRALVMRVRSATSLPAVLAVLAMFSAVELFPGRMPGAVYLTGIIFGIWTALVAASLVLVYRSSRIVNFAAYQFGGTAVVLFIETIHHHYIARLLASGVRHGQPFPGWALQTEYWLAAALALTVAAALSGLTYLLVVRRFAGAPPLVGTVATIAVSSLFAAVTLLAIQDLFKDPRLTAVTTPPTDPSITLGGVIFTLPALITLGLGLITLPLLEMYLRRSRVGTAVRAAADNPERASTLGVDGARVTVVVWLIAGTLSGVSALLVVATTGPSNIGGVVSLVPALAAFVLAGTVSLRLAFVAAVATGVFQQGLLWSFGNGNLLDVLLLLVMVVVLLLRRRRGGSRVDASDGAWQAAREVRPVPPELAGLPDVRRLRIRVAIVVGVLALVYPFVMPTGGVADGSLALIEAMIGLSLLTLTGWTGLISLGQFGFAGVGAFVAAILSGSFHLSALIALPLGALAGAIVAFAVGLPALRIRGVYLAVVTLAFSVATAIVLLNPLYAGRWLPSSLNRPHVLGLATNDERVYYLFCLLITAGVGLAVAGMRRSRTGRALIASRDNEQAAAMFGINLVRARLTAFVFSGAVAALAGGLFAFQQRAVDVGNFGPAQSVTMFLMVIVGGLGALSGPIMGAVFIALLVLSGQSALGTLGLPIAVLAVLFAAPGGLVQAVYAARDSILRRIAIRNRIVVPSLVSASHPGWSPEALIALSEPVAPAVRRYTLHYAPLDVPKVAATGKGA